MSNYVFIGCFSCRIMSRRTPTFTLQSAFLH